MKKLFVLFIVALWSPIIKGQNVDYPKIMPDIAVPSPSSLSQSVYGNISSDNYTGKPSISIPLCTVESGRIKIPITLCYNARGIKVSQEASWVGLGWSLDVGGVITRNKKGLDDFKSTRGYIDADNVVPSGGSYSIPNYNSNLICYYQPTDIGYYGQIQEYFSGLTDGQPDDFSYNFMGYSGELFFEKQSGQQVVYATQIEQNDLEIRYDREEETWEIIDEKGWKYYFEAKERCQTLASTTISFEEYPSGTLSESFISAWYLSHVETPEGDEITLTYQSDNEQNLEYFRSQPSYDQILKTGPYTDFTVNNGPGLVIPTAGNTFFTSSLSYVDEVYLERIDFNQGSIIFNTIDRIDRIASVNSNRPQALDNITIRDLNEDVVKIFAFDYSYFNSNKIGDPDQEKYLRLKLDKVKECVVNSNNQSTCLNPYKFEYNTTELPKKTSYEIDNWGYYNGASQNNSIINYHFENLVDILNGNSLIVNETTPNISSSLRPKYVYLESTGDFKKLFFNGANREVNENYIQASILDGILYPTGGYTKLIYSPNEYNSESPIIIEEEHTVYSHSNTSEEVITVPVGGAFVLLNFEFNNYLPGSGVVQNMIFGLSVQSSPGVWHDFLKFLPSQGDQATTNITSDIVIALDPGVYKIKANNGGYVELHLQLKATFLYQTNDSRKKADGLRIQSVINRESKDGPVLSKTTYDYDDESQSSGILMSESQPFFNETDLLAARLLGNINPDCCFLGSIIQNPIAPSWLFLWASSVRPISQSARGNQIGYSKVTTHSFNNVNEILSKTVYYYYNEPDNPTAFFLPALPGTKDLKNGQLEKIEFYSGNDKKVKETTYTYGSDLNSARSVIGVICFKPTTLLPGFYSLDGAIANFYITPSIWNYKVSEESNVYASDGSNNFTKQYIKYFYEGNSHKLPTKVLEYQDDKTTVLKGTINKYAPDINIGVYAEMTSKHMLNNIVEKVELVGDKITNSTLTTYKSHIDSYVLDNIYKLETLTSLNSFNYFDGANMDSHYNSLIPEIKFNLYNSSLYPIEVQTRDNLHRAFLYDKFDNPISVTKNSNYNNCAYTGFENNINNAVSDYWYLYGAITNDYSNIFVHTGNFSLKLDGSNSNNYIQKDFTLNDITNNIHSGYKLSVWGYNHPTPATLKIRLYLDQALVNEASTPSSDVDKWYLLQVELPRAKYFDLQGIHTIRAEVQCSGGIVYVDDLRFCPMDAEMTTYTYKPIVGITSTSDIDNRPTYYEYDSFGRLRLVKDYLGNILKKYEYNLR